jgi:flavin reductase (DIM6/NTAB) family NADH-FMN oxidoreductase RutF
MSDVPTPTPPTQREFRSTMARFVTGVTVMTSLDRRGLPHGMTANAVSSLSLDPLLVLVCVDRGATMAEVVTAGRVFALSVLAADQEQLSEHFADVGRGFGLEEFDGVATRAGVTGAPLLEGAAAWLDCRVHDVLDGGDHVVVLGEVVLAEEGPGHGGLLYTPDGYEVWLPTGD